MQKSKSDPISLLHLKGAGFRASFDLTKAKTPIFEKKKVQQLWTLPTVFASFRGVGT